MDAARRYQRALVGRVASPANRSLQTALDASLRAHMELARGQTTTALDRLEAIDLEGWIEQVGFSPFYSRAYDRLVIAELLRETGEYGRALDWYGSLTEGYEVLFVGPAHYRMAGIYDTLGDTASAGKHMREFGRLWAGADSSALESLRSSARW